MATFVDQVAALARDMVDAAGGAFRFLKTGSTYKRLREVVATDHIACLTEGFPARPVTPARRAVQRASGDV